MLVLLISVAFERGVFRGLARRVPRECHNPTQLCYAPSLFEAKLACSLCVRFWHRRDSFREYSRNARCSNGAEINSNSWRCARALPQPSQRPLPIFFNIFATHYNHLTLNHLWQVIKVISDCRCKYHSILMHRIHSLFYIRNQENYHKVYEWLWYIRYVAIFTTDKSPYKNNNAINEYSSSNNFIRE